MVETDKQSSNAVFTEAYIKVISTLDTFFSSQNLFALEYSYNFYMLSSLDFVSISVNTALEL